MGKREDNANAIADGLEEYDRRQWRTLWEWLKKYWFWLVLIPLIIVWFQVREDTSLSIGIGSAITVFMIYNAIYSIYLAIKLRRYSLHDAADYFGSIWSHLVVLLIYGVLIGLYSWVLCSSVYIADVVMLCGACATFIAYIICLIIRGVTLHQIGNYLLEQYYRKKEAKKRRAKRNKKAE